MKRRSRRTHSRAEQHARVLRELDLVVQNDVQGNNPIEEQLRQCPKAFEVGKIVEQLCESLKYDRDGSPRMLPPAGVIIPPIV